MIRRIAFRPCARSPRAGRGRPRRRPRPGPTRPRAGCAAGSRSAPGRNPPRPRRGRRGARTAAAPSPRGPGRCTAAAASWPGSSDRFGKRGRMHQVPRRGHAALVEDRGDGPAGIEVLGRLGAEQALGERGLRVGVDQEHTLARGGRACRRGDGRSRSCRPRPSCSGTRRSGARSNPPSLPVVHREPRTQIYRQAPVHREPVTHFQRFMGVIRSDGCRAQYRIGTGAIRAGRRKLFD